MVGHTALGPWQSHQIPPPSLHGGEGPSFPDWVPPDDTVNSDSLVGMQFSDSGMVIRYQDDEFTHT